MSFFCIVDSYKKFKKRHHKHKSFVQNDYVLRVEVNIWKASFESSVRAFVHIISLL